MAKTHELKTWPEHFRAVVAPSVYKRKLVEIRKDDRGFETGHNLWLREYDQHKQEYTGAEATAKVSHCLRGGPWLPDGYVAMSIVVEELKL